MGRQWLVTLASCCVATTAISTTHNAAILRQHDDAIYTTQLSVLDSASPVDFFARGIAWHKSGSVMMREAIALINVKLTLRVAEGALEKVPGLAEHDQRVGVLAQEGNGVNFSKTGGLYEAYMFTPMRPPGPQSRFFAIYRNPVEMAVSELAYDAEEDNHEAYERQRLTPEGTARCHDRGHPDGSKDAYLRQYCDGQRDVLVASETYLKGVLPPPGKDTWSEYVHRLLDGGQEDEALLASAIFMLAVSIKGGAQLATFQRIERPDSARSCEADYDDASASECEAVWRSMLGALVDWTNQTAPSIAGLQVVAGTSAFGMASGPLGGSAGFGQLMEELVAAAATTCPAVDTKAVTSHSGTNASNTTQPADRLARLSRLDAEYLNGTLAEVAAIIACNASARYKPEVN